MDHSEIVEAIALLEARAMDDVADYVVRGRRWQHLDDDALSDRFLGRARAWAANPANGMIAGEIADVTSEFTLRGGEPPLDAARDHLATAVAGIAGEMLGGLSAEAQGVLAASLARSDQPN
jgi:hypothetical protein